MIWKTKKKKMLPPVSELENILKARYSKILKNEHNPFIFHVTDFMKIPVMIETVFLYSVKLLNKLVILNYVSFSETICKHQSVHFIVHSFSAMD